MCIWYTKKNHADENKWKVVDLLQFERTIIALDGAPMVDRAWLYTGITRAEGELHIVGSEANFKKAVKSLSARYKRKTWLDKLINEEFMYATRQKERPSAIARKNLQVAN